MNNILNKLYDIKLKEIKNAIIFGEYIDINDPKQIALAFYCLGQNETRIENQKQHEHDMDILMGK